MLIRLVGNVSKVRIGQGQRNILDRHPGDEAIPEIVFASLRVSVNISARDLLNRELPEMIAQLLDRYGTPASMLCLEITESGFMEDPVYSQKVLERLHELGVLLSIDDYGTGYSSLS